MTSTVTTTHSFYIGTPILIKDQQRNLIGKLFKDGKITLEELELLLKDSKVEYDDNNPDTWVGRSIYPGLPPYAQPTPAIYGNPPSTRFDNLPIGTCSTYTNKNK